MKRKNLWFNPVAQERIKEVKRELCGHLVRLSYRRQWTPRQMAIRLGTTESRISHVFNAHTDQLTLSQLFRYLAIADPRFQILIAI